MWTIARKIQDKFQETSAAISRESRVLILGPILTKTKKTH